MDNNYELPNTEIIIDNDFKRFIEDARKKDVITIPLGKEEDSIYSEEIQSMPNLIVGGTVMSGKSSFVHTIISTILLTRKPSETKLVILDSKKVEYKQYDGLYHLLVPIVSDVKRGALILSAMCDEVKNRLDLIEAKGFKNIDQYNDSINENDVHLPDIVIIVDDFDSFSIDDSVGDSIDYISKFGWNVNVYLAITSNHPSSKIISTIAKTNFPSRLCFNVPSKRDSMVILDEPDAYNLRNLGDAYYKSRSIGKLKRICAIHLTDSEINLIIDYIIKEQKRVYGNITAELPQNEEIKNNKHEGEYDDPLYDEIVEYVITTGRVSASLLQRKFKLGYNRAEMIMDLLEERGIIGPLNGSRPREVLVKMEPSEEPSKKILNNKKVNNKLKEINLTNNQRLLLSFILIAIILIVLFVFM